MKKLIFILAILLTLTIWSCSTEEIQNTESKKESTFRENGVSPVYGINGLYSKSKGKHYCNIQWSSEYGFPFLIQQPHYVTIWKDGVLVAMNYTETYNRFSIEVSRNSTQSTFTIIQTLIGVGESVAVQKTIYKP